MRAGLNGDWDNTVGTILKNGKPVLKNKIEPTFFFCSTWAVPAIEFYDEEKGKIVRENCFYESEIPPEFDPEIPWPEPYLEDYWIREFETFGEETDAQDDCAPPKSNVPKENFEEKAESHLWKPSKEGSLSFKNSLKTIENHITAIKTEFERLFRLVPKEDLSSNGVEEITSTMMPLTEYILSIYDSFAENGQINSIDPTDEEFLEKVFKEVPQMMKKVLEEKEKSNKTDEDELKILRFTQRATDFLDNFRNLIVTYLEWKLTTTLEISSEELRNITGKGRFN